LANPLWSAGLAQAAARGADGRCMDDDTTPTLRMRPAAPTWIPRQNDHQPAPLEEVLASVRVPKAPRLPSNVAG
jgi:hypothetical protein